MRTGESGFTYLAALFAIAITAALASKALLVWHTVELREREAELLFVGEAYRSAIGSYYRGSPGTQKRYPPDLNALLLDTRMTRTVRHLRRLYRDPVSGADEWGVVEAPDGGVMGVYSLSPGAPIKQGGFAKAQKGFEGAKRYEGWKFQYVPDAGGR